ncbi:hypothetical protein N431DRAFT_499448 [Stipitochalara longipes BDJ]|nr:hypothetical protein N431DRAFT_499448 [Stipitochalara longipes BDJ]
MSLTTSSQNQTNYTLYNYSTHTHQELSAACQQRRLASAGYKHDLLRRLISDDLEEMWKTLLNKEWNPACPPFLEEAAQIQEARSQGAYQFYVAKCEYLRARMEAKKGIRRG